MRGRVQIAALLFCLAACGGHRPPLPPPIFPATTSWRVELEAPLDTPLASDGRRVFALSEGGELRALEPSTGRELWRKRVPAGALSASPGLLLLRRPNGRILLLDPATGDERRRVDSGIVGQLPAVATSSEILVAGEGAAAVEREDGRIRWTVPPGESAAAIAPVVAGQCVLIGERNGNLRCRDLATGETLWFVYLGEGTHGPPLPDERSRLYMGTAARAIVALRADKRGAQDWRWRTGGAAPFEARLLGERLIVATLGNVVYGLDRRNGHMTWIAPLPSRPLGAPLLFGTAILVPCHESVIEAFDTEDGRSLGSLHAPSPFMDTPLLVGDTLVLPLRNPWALAGMRLAAHASEP